MRIGIFGGSFDPIHVGHLILAEQCREQAKLDQVWFVPCALQPHKESGAHATDRQRSEMIALAIAGHESFRLSKVELERGGVSYTVETLAQIAEQQPDAELFLLMGDDSLESFSKWREPEKILQLAIPLVVNRPGNGAVDLSALGSLVDEQRLAEFERYCVESPAIEISSRGIRENVKSERSVRFLLPRAVEKYIETQRVYDA